MSFLISVGQNIKILRSNGKFQNVKISKLFEDGETALVEWVENGEDKGKEVKISQIAEWNPEVKKNEKENENIRFRKTKIPNVNPNLKNRKTIFYGTGGLGLHKTDRKTNIAQNLNRLEPVKRKMSVANTDKKRSANENSGRMSMSGAKNEFLEMIQNFQDTIPLNPMNYDNIRVNTKIVVCVRKRPISKDSGDIDVISTPEPNSILVHECKYKVDLTKYLENQSFNFDYVFNENVNNVSVYKYCAKPLIDCLFSGGRATIFAYGQTGSGKTYTMSGDPSNPKSIGIYQYTISDVFERLNKSKNLYAYVSLFEIYGGKIFDLLNKRKLLRMLEDSHGQVQICELIEINVDSAGEALKIISDGSKLRSSGTTSANAHSSRSHSIFQISLKKKQPGRGNKFILFGKFSMIDLAGNERGVDTANCDRQTRLEGAEINKSLLALKECIRALNRKGGHLPFRASKLTQVLRDSFICENSKTCMIATISPGLSCCENTLNTLRYTDRVKEIESDKRVDNQPSNENDDSIATICNENNNLYQFHKTVDNIFTSEEELYNHHVTMVSDYSNWINDEKNLLNSIESGNENIENYVNSLQNIVSDRLLAFRKLQEKLNIVKAQLNEEELASKKIKHLPTF